MNLEPSSDAAVPTPARDIGRARRTVGRVAVVHSKRGHDTVLVDALTLGRERPTFVVLDGRVADRLDRHEPTVLMVDHTTDDFNVARLCTELQRRLDVPIVVVTTEPNATDDPWLEAALRAGASAVVGAGASPSRLLAQLRAVMRWSPGPRRNAPPPIVVGDVVIDLDAMAVSIAGAPVPCSPLRLRALTVLAEAPNHVVTVESLVERLWRPDTVAVRRRLRNVMRSLRALLGEGPRRPRIETVTPVGYRLAVPS